MIYKITDKILIFYEDQRWGMNLLQSFIFAVAFLALFPPRMLLTFTVYEKIDLYLKLIVVMYIYLISICYLVRYKKLPFLIVAVMIYCVALFFSTFINHGDIKLSIWTNGIITVAVALLIWNAVERGLDWYLRLLYLIYYGAILINLYFVLKTVGVEIPDSMEKTFFFGNYNGFILWFLPAQVLGYILCKRSGKKVIKASFLLLCLLNFGVISYVKSATSTVVLFIFDLYMLLFNRETLKRIFNIYMYLTANILFFIGVVVLRVQNGFMANIVSHLGKNMTFSGRTPIWDQTMHFISQSPIIGAGFESMPDLESKLGFTTSHNMFLEILFKGGAVALIFFIVIVAVVLFRIAQSGKINYKINGCISIFLGCYFLATQFESHSNISSVMYFSIVYFVLDALSKERVGGY